mgnify:CR=1 FL=1
MAGAIARIAGAPPMLAFELVRLTCSRRFRVGSTRIPWARVSSSTGINDLEARSEKRTKYFLSRSAFTWACTGDAMGLQAIANLLECRRNTLLAAKLDNEVENLLLCRCERGTNARRLNRKRKPTLRDGLRIALRDFGTHLGCGSVCDSRFDSTGFAAGRARGPLDLGRGDSGLLGSSVTSRWISSLGFTFRWDSRSRALGRGGGRASLHPPHHFKKPEMHRRRGAFRSLPDPRTGPGHRCDQMKSAVVIRNRMNTATGKSLKDGAPLDRTLRRLRGDHHGWPTRGFYSWFLELDCG